MDISDSARDEIKREDIEMDDLPTYLNSEETEPSDESIEGLGEDIDASLGDYPIDTLLIRNESRTVFDVLRRIEKGTFVMDPDFQRDFIWKEEKQVKLIESVLMRIPLPVFYLAENQDGQMVVVDGLQRLSTFQRYVNNSFPLKLPKQSELNNKRFRDLSPKLQNRIEDCNLVLYIIDAKVPNQALLDIFERVNSGLPLTRQQMRNCLFTGAATKLLKDEANLELFKKATGGSLNTATMRDREFINRFCAFHILPLSLYKGDMDDFLAQALEEMNQQDQQKLDTISAEFRKSLKNNMIVFGKHAFRKHSPMRDSRSVINASLWDVMSTGFTQYSENVVEANKKQLQKAVQALFNETKFDDAITLGTNQVDRVKSRFNLFHEMLEEVLP